MYKIEREQAIIKEVVDIYGDYQSICNYNDKDCVVCKKQISGEKKWIKGFALDKNCYRKYELLTELKEL